MSKEVNLEPIAREIADLLTKHDVAGTVVLSDGKGSGALKVVDPKWSVIRVDAEKGMLTFLNDSEEYPSYEERLKAYELTDGMLKSLTYECRRLGDILERLNGELSEAFGVVDVPDVNDDNFKVLKMNRDGSTPEGMKNLDPDVLLGILNHVKHGEDLPDGVEVLDFDTSSTEFTDTKSSTKLH